MLETSSTLTPLVSGSELLTTESPGRTVNSCADEAVDLQIQLRFLYRCGYNINLIIWFVLPGGSVEIGLGLMSCGALLVDYV